MKRTVLIAVAGAAAGVVNGLFGSGGGMVLIPMLSLCHLEEDALFPTCVAIVLPICVTSLLFYGSWDALFPALPYMAGGAIGGFLAGKWGKSIPALWLHRITGAFILWGGARYLWRNLG